MLQVTHLLEFLAVYDLATLWQHENVMCFFPKVKGLHGEKLNHFRLSQKNLMCEKSETIFKYKHAKFK